MHADGNIQLSLYDPGESFVAVSATDTNNESVYHDTGGLSGVYG